jgi:acyl-CoA dehydrogenase
MDFELGDDTRLMRDAFLDWVKGELVPLEEKEKVDPDAGIPEELVARVRRRSAELGYYSHHMPAEVGGGGFTMLDSVVLREAAGSTGSVLAGVAIAGPEGPSPMHLMFDARQREKYLAPLVRGETSVCFMLSEPGAGSDAQAVSTRAEKRGDHYVLNGAKHFITNGKHASWGVVFAATDPAKKAKGGISAFIVERGMYQVGRAHQGMAGFEGQTEIVFEDAVVPAENLVGREGFAFGAAMKFLGTGRLQIAANCVGIAEYLLGVGTAYAKQRETFGEPLAARQAIQWMIADSATEIYAARHMCRHAAWLVDRGEDATRELSMCKLHATEMVNRVCDRVLQIHGGVGWMRGYPTERYYRQLRVLRIVEGASEIQRMIIARSVLGDGAR